jgi:protein phosphatase 2C family protein 2/3
MMSLSSLLAMVCCHELVSAIFANKSLGIWDCQSSQAVVEFVRRGVAAKQELSSICENLMDNCLAKTSDTGGVGCDNMTVIIIALLQGKTKEEWYNAVAERVAAGDGPCAPPEFGMSHRYSDSVSEQT